MTSETYTQLLSWYQRFGHKYPLEFRARFSRYLLLTRYLRGYEK